MSSARQMDALTNNADNQTGTGSLNPVVRRLRGLSTVPSSEVAGLLPYSYLTIDLLTLPSGSAAGVGMSWNSLVELATGQRVLLGVEPGSVVLTTDATWVLSRDALGVVALERYSVLERGAPGPATRISRDVLAFTITSPTRDLADLLATDPRRGFWVLIGNRFDQRYELYSFDGAFRQRGAPIVFSSLSGWPYARPYVVNERGLWITTQRGAAYSLLNLGYDGRVRTVTEVSSVLTLSTGSGCVALWAVDVPRTHAPTLRGQLLLFDQNSGELVAAIEPGGVPAFDGDTMFLSSTSHTPTSSEGLLRRFEAE
jgi:hypothetical protein